jgi:hypothetical protein
VWYAIAETISAFDIELIQRFRSQNYIVAVLIMQVEKLNEQQLVNLIETIKNSLPVIRIYKVSMIRENSVQKNCTWKNLITWSFNLFPTAIKELSQQGKEEYGEQKNRTALYLGIAAAVLVSILLIRACNN